MYRKLLAATSILALAALVVAASIVAPLERGEQARASVAAQD